MALTVGEEGTDRETTPKRYAGGCAGVATIDSGTAMLPRETTEPHRRTSGAPRRADVRHVVAERE